VKLFNDPPTDEPNYWPSVRLADVYEVARRLRQTGMRDVRLLPDWLLGVTFHDPLIKGRVRLEIESWYDESPGWFWYAHVQVPHGFSVGPLTRKRWITNVPWPREVVRGYREFTRYERRSPPRKR
jgi:hypothetical protein